MARTWLWYAVHCSGHVARLFCMSFSSCAIFRIGLRFLRFCFLCWSVSHFHDANIVKTTDIAKHHFHTILLFIFLPFLPVRALPLFYFSSQFLIRSCGWSNCKNNMSQDDLSPKKWANIGDIFTLVDGYALAEGGVAWFR